MDGAAAVGIRDHYADHPEGAEGWYRDFGSTYRNPHEDAVVEMLELAVRWWPSVVEERVLDLACGSGEVTLGLLAAGVPLGRIGGCDPFTSAAYLTRVGRACEPYSFADIAGGALSGRTYSGVVCSYALHLCEPSWLPTVCLGLAEVAPSLVVITPHKRPELRPAWGWELADEHRDEALRVRVRYYERTAKRGRSTQ